MMKCCVLIVLSLLWPGRLCAQSHADVVAAVKAELQGRGVELAGPCGAFQITERVAWRLRADGAGLLSKPSGNNCNGFAVDIVAYRDGHIVDMLSDAGSSNGPTWQDAGMVDAALWRAVLNPDPGSVVPPAGTTPGNGHLPSTDLQFIEQRLTGIEANLVELQRRVRDLQVQETTDTDAIRGDIKSFRERAGEALKVAMKYAIPVIAGLLSGRELAK